ncbi:hypothetical protein V6C39_02410 [Dickeya ananatis]
MNRLKRRVSNIALPEYVLPHAKGKFTVPLLSSAQDMPQFEDINGERFYRFTNWQGDVCRWQDS